MPYLFRRKKKKTARSCCLPIIGYLQYAHSLSYNSRCYSLHQQVCTLQYVLIKTTSMFLFSQNTLVQFRLSMHPVDAILVFFLILMPWDCRSWLLYLQRPHTRNLPALIAKIQFCSMLRTFPPKTSCSFSSSTRLRSSVCSCSDYIHVSFPHMIIS